MDTVLTMFLKAICDDFKDLLSLNRRKKHAIHSSDTTSSDEERFERRKSKSMTRARNRLVKFYCYFPCRKKEQFLYFECGFYLY